MYLHTLKPYIYRYINIKTPPIFGFFIGTKLDKPFAGLLVAAWPNHSIPKFQYAAVVFFLQEVSAVLASLSYRVRFFENPSGW